MGVRRADKSDAPLLVPEEFCACECRSPQILKRKELRLPVVALSVSAGKTGPRKLPCAHAQGYESHRLRFRIFDGPPYRTGLVPVASSVSKRGSSVSRATVVTSTLENPAFFRNEWSALSLNPSQTSAYSSRA